MPRENKFVIWVPAGSEVIWAKSRNHLQERFPSLVSTLGEGGTIDCMSIDGEVLGTVHGSNFTNFSLPCFGDLLNPRWG
jgi:hypothetical protein